MALYVKCFALNCKSYLILYVHIYELLNHIMNVIQREVIQITDNLKINLKNTPVALIP